MTRTDEFIGQLESYLEDYEGSTPLPEAVRDAIRAELPLTRQRPAWWPARRLPIMNTTIRYTAAAAAVAVAAILGYSYFATPNVGDLPAPSPSPTPMPLEDGPLAPGRHAITDVIPSTIVVTVPGGWQKNVVPAALWTPDSNAHIGFSRVTNVYVDPCTPAPVLNDPAIGPSVDDLVAALASLPDFEVSAPVDVMVAGYAGKELELTPPEDCEPGRLWRSQPVNDDVPIEAHATVWILDANGERLVILAQDRPGAASSDIAEMREMVESLQVAP